MQNQIKRYFLKKPTGKRKSYVLVCYLALDRKKKKYVPLSEEIGQQTKKINQHLKSGIVETHEAELLFREIILNEKNAAKARHLLSLDNQLEYENDLQSLIKKYIQPFLSFVIFTIWKSQCCKKIHS